MTHKGIPHELPGMYKKPFLKPVLSLPPSWAACLALLLFLELTQPRFSWCKVSFAAIGRGMAISMAAGKGIILDRREGGQILSETRNLHIAPCLTFVGD